MSDAATQSNGVFRNLIGYQGAKAVLRAALRDGGVNILLEGPPASGKSVALLAIEDYAPNSEYRDAAGFSEVQLRETFAENYSTLCLDEVDAMRRGAYEAMSTPMEHGRVTKDTANRQYDVDISTQVVAACNDAGDLPAHIASRFRTIEFDEYTYDEYVDVCGKLLTESVEWIRCEEHARNAAMRVHESIGTKDPRDARDAAKLANSAAEIADIAKALDDPKAEVDSEPLTPEELRDAHEEERQARGVKSPDEVLSDMADIEDVGEKSVEEVKQIIGQSSASAPETDPGLRFIEKAKEQGSPTLSNPYGQPIVELIVHDSIADATKELVDENDLRPRGDEAIAVPPSLAEDRPGVAETLVAFQFKLDEPGEPESSGYDLEAIADRLEELDEDAIATKSPTAEYELF